MHKCASDLACKRAEHPFQTCTFVHLATISDRDSSGKFILRLSVVDNISKKCYFFIVTYFNKRSLVREITNRKT